jgi:hypothetical protein
VFKCKDEPLARALGLLVKVIKEFEAENQRP